MLEEERQRETNLEENIGLLDSNNEVDNETLINTARYWIILFTQEEEGAI